MKFIPNAGAPNIPLEILEAQEAGNLVFFCGAGISYPAGLPNFSKLVDDVYANLGASPDEQEQQAIKMGLYDRALGHLERRYYDGASKNNLVKQAIMDSLHISDETDVSTHKAILDLSCTENNKFRVVTTNVDHGFTIADPGLKTSIDAAPKLPVPKPHKWGGVTHLHGIINKETDPNGEHLVFTSGDFGTAYLTERWASKFVTELFSHFTVLFVGYSINDPVIRYMTDAIAAEIRLGYKNFKKPYIIIHTPPKDRKKNEELWKARDVHPIFYSYGHSNLHQTLKAWAAYVRDGLNGKARIISTKASYKPIPPYEHDESIQQVIDTLKEKNSSSEGITGYPAKVFARLDPPAPIEWLPVLDEHGLLQIADINDKVFPVSSYSASNTISPCEISLNLWHWLLKHLEEDALVLWVINKGQCLHPRLNDLIRNQLVQDDKTVNEPYLSFWRIVTSNILRFDSNVDVDKYDKQKEFNKFKDHLSKIELLTLLEPKISLTKSYSWSLMHNEETQDKPYPFQAEIVIALDDWEYDDLRKRDEYPNEFLSLLASISTTLNRTMDLWEFLGYANEWNDHSYWDIVSISPHQQNSQHDSWTVLIQLCRDLWEKAAELDPILAMSIIKLWNSFKYPIFQRLIFHAFTVSDVVDVDESLTYLLAKNGRWLWSTTAQREKFRLLNKIWPKLSSPSVTTLIDAVLDGPPRKNLSNDEWLYRYDRDIWHFLSKLNSFGRQIPIQAQEKLNEITKKYPMWQLEDGNRDEFSHWSETRSGHNSDISTDEMLLLSDEEILGKLQEKNPEYRDGRWHIFQNLAKQAPLRVLSLISNLQKTSPLINKIWHKTLVGLTESDQTLWQKVALLLLDADSSLFTEEAWAISWWLSKASANIEAYSEDEHYFWLISNKILDSYTKKAPVESKDVVTAALNDPTGIIAGSIIERLNQCKLQTDEGIPEPEHLSIINRIMTEDDDSSFVLARVYFASRLQYLYAIDHKWTKKYLIPLFDWANSSEASQLWQAYLWNPRINIDLAVEIKDFILDSLQNSNRIQKGSKQLHQLFVLICLEYPDLYSATQQRKALSQLHDQGLNDIAEFLYRSMSNKETNREQYWNNRVKVFMTRAWPKNIKTHTTSEYLSLMCLGLTESFADSVVFLKVYIAPFPKMGRFLRELNKSSLSLSEPTKVFELISYTFTKEYQHPGQYFRELLDKLIKQNPELIEDQNYRVINEFLILNGI